MLPKGGEWDEAMHAAFALPVHLALGATRGNMRAQLSLTAGRVKRRIAAYTRTKENHERNLNWMAAYRYHLCWPYMRYFALPSFHDGRIRLNLTGRERRGLVARADYEATLDEIESVLRGCIDPQTGRLAIARFERPAPADPRRLDPMQSDLLVYWAGAPTGLFHRTVGTVGPLPVRRPGGHTGGHGVAWFSGRDIAAGDGGEVSAFDVVPTLLDYLGVRDKPFVSGRSRIDRLYPVRVVREPALAPVEA
jgi:hypothetical protein